MGPTRAEPAGAWASAPRGGGGRASIDRPVKTTETESILSARRSELADHHIVTVVLHPDPEVVGAREPLSRGEVRAGRGDCRLLPGVFDRAKVSREHAAFAVTDGRVLLRDLSSRNGTAVNGHRIDEAVLAEGDVVNIGGVLLLYHRGPRAYREPSHPLLLGTSWALASLLATIDEVAHDAANVMLIGETGTGKELVARAIHEASERSGAFVPVNCGGLAEGVLHSELFGHTRGAFSGANVARRGLIDEARQGTLFLDEIGAAPTSLQTALLRLLETGEYRVVGASELSTASVRFIAATQPDVEEQMSSGAFRSDLWYRLARRVVRVPPLRERREDILLLASWWAERCSRRRAHFSPELATALLRHDWPGNVRELLAVTERLVAGQDGGELALPPWLVEELRPASAPVEAPPRRRVKRPARAALVASLAAHDGSVADTARQLGVDRKTLYRWLSALSIDLDALRDQP